MNADPSHDALNQSAGRLIARWNLTDPVPIARTAMALVLKVTRPDGSPAVLKCLSSLGRSEEGTAPWVLDALGPEGAVQVLGSDEAGHLLEHCAGPQLLHWPNGREDRAAVPVIADIVRRMHARVRKRPDGVPSLAERCLALDRAIPLADEAHRSVLRQAREVAHDLLATERPSLLHGDLHHENIMRAERAEGDTWLAIDPQGVWGDPAYEVANIFGNPRNHPAITLAPDRAKSLATKLAGLLSFDPDRLLGWAFVHSCVSAAWSIKDGLDPSYRIAVAETIEKELRR